MPGLGQTEGIEVLASGNYHIGNGVASSVMRMESTTGGLFNAAEPTPVQDTNYGTMLIVFAGCNNAQVSFDFPGPGLSGSFPIERVVGDNIALCESLAE